MKPHSFFAISLCLTASALPVEHALAQAAAQPAQDNAIAAEGYILVTAQKIVQRAIDVPITMSVLDGARMEQLGVSDLDELSNYVPGLNIQEQSANNPGIVIRGITSDSGSAQQGPRGHAGTNLSQHSFGVPRARPRPRGASPRSPSRSGPARSGKTAL